MMPGLDRTIHQMDPNLGVRNEFVMDDRINDSPAAFLNRSSAWLVGGFAVSALLLGAIGLYGVIAYSVSQRTREIGVRMALGAQREAVYRLILGQAGFVAAVGIVVGLVCSIPAARLLRGLLFGVQSWDVPTLIGVAMVLGICALLTSYLPARRAASMNPVEALRAEYYFLCRQDSISLHSEGLWKRLTSFYIIGPEERADEPQSCHCCYRSNGLGAVSFRPADVRLRCVQRGRS